MTHPLFLHSNCVEPLADATINHREFFRLLMASRSSRPIALAPYDGNREEFVREDLRCLRALLEEIPR